MLEKESERLPVSKTNNEMNQEEFERRFESLTHFAPLPWQRRLYLEYFDQGRTPKTVDIPTGLGKTAVTALWLIAIRAERKLPRRLIYIVDRRAVVDQATRFVEGLRKNEEKLRKEQKRPEDPPLPISTLRGQHADNREWLDDPGEPAIIVGTVDMIGSRLLFEGYGVSRKMRPYHAGLLGTDALFVLDEAHLVPPFERLLRDIARERNTSLGAADETDRSLLPPLRVISLSATGRESTTSTSKQTFSLDDLDINAAGAGAKLTRKRLDAAKTLYLNTCKRGELVETLAEKVWTIAESGAKAGRYLIFCNARKDAEAVRKALEQRIKGSEEPEIELFVGARRNYERQAAEKRLQELGFITAEKSKTGAEKAPKNNARFLIATSAGEVGVDMDADHMVCDLVAWDRMVQRLGRVNRRGDGDAQVHVYDAGPPDAKSNETDLAPSQAMLQHTRNLIEALRRPVADDGHDASPGSIRELKRRTDAEIIAKASTPAPLRPALTRPLLDAWAMTSLREHTGRPEVAPWLRGWIENEHPRTTVVWRAYLPVPTNTEERRRRWEREARKYFQTTPPHLLEKLETETYRVVDWLTKRVKKLHKSALAEKRGRENGRDPDHDAWMPEQIVAMTLNTAGDLEKTFTLHDFDKKRLQYELTGKTLVVLGRLGGLSEGMLDDKHDAAPDWLADEQPLDPPSEEEQAQAVPWRIHHQKHPVEEDDSDKGQHANAWCLVHRFVLKHAPDGEIGESLDVFKQRINSTEEARALGKNQSLEKHQTWAKEQAADLAKRLELPERYGKLLALAARLHDEGKQAERWQNAFSAPKNGRPYAKTTGPLNPHLLHGYRHEFGSLHYIRDNSELNALPQDDQDLVLHLIAAHHGNARPILSTDGCDHAPPSQLEEQAREVAQRFARLQRRWGPWGLAWWETLLRAADQQASKQNQEGNE